MKDLTMHSDDELSLQVFNDQYFYSEIDHPEYLMALIKEEFVYTTKQMETLVEDLNDYLMEINVQQQLARGEAE